MVVKIKDIDYHRNGVSGKGFYVVLFKDRTGDVMESEMLAVVDPESYIATYVIGLDSLNNLEIGIGMGNHWRGDHYASVVRKAINKDQRQRWGTTYPEERLDETWDEMIAERRVRAQAAIV
jgi:hypothetical protein